MSKTAIARAASGLCGAARYSLVFHVLLVGAGVSVPATAADDGARRRAERSERDRDERSARPQRQGRGQGERGHVRRRGDLIDRSTHVEKRQSWRRID